MKDWLSGALQQYIGTIMFGVIVGLVFMGVGYSKYSTMILSNTTAISTMSKSIDELSNIKVDILLIQSKQADTEEIFHSVVKDNTKTLNKVNTTLEITVNKLLEIERRVTRLEDNNH